MIRLFSFLRIRKTMDLMPVMKKPSVMQQEDIITIQKIINERRTD